MQQTLRVTLKRDPDVTATVDVTYEDDEWMEGARQGISEAAKMVGNVSRAADALGAALHDPTPAKEAMLRGAEAMAKAVEEDAIQQS